MLTVHHKGSARLGSFPPDLAEAKVAEVLAHAEASGSPLRVTVSGA